MMLHDLNSKKVVIVGYGIDGKSAEAFLKKHTTAEITILDQKDGADYLDNLEKYDIAIRSPGVSKNRITIPSTTALNLFFSMVKGRTIGVTGTKGKSTTAALIAHVLQRAGYKAQLAGNSGVPVLEALDKTNTPEDVWVLELSSYMLDDVAYSPDVAVVINLYPEHIDYHGSVKAYYGAKQNILSHMDTEDFFVYNADFTELEEWAAHTHAKKVPYTPDKEFLKQHMFQTELKGDHNIFNIQAVYSVARLYTVSDDIFAHALQTFQPLPHRLQNVGTYQGIIFIDDAISTTPQSTIAAIQAVPPVGSLLLGGLDRGYDFTQLVETIQTNGIQAAVFFPDSGSKILGMLKERQFTPAHVLETDSMDAAVKFLFAHTPPGQVCLLSTASPSYSIWKNFEEKGDEFQKWVHYYGRTTDQKETTNRQENSEQDQDKTESV